MKTTIARFKGTVQEQCSVGGSLSLRGIYEIADPDGNRALYERHTSQIRGMGWARGEAPTHGRVAGWIGRNGHYSAVGIHVQRYDGPEAIEVNWVSKADAAYAAVAIALAGRAHMPKWQRDREPANPFWQEAAEKARAEAKPGWSLSEDTGHGEIVEAAPDMSAAADAEKARLEMEFDLLLNKEIVSRVDANPHCLKDTDEATIARTVAFNCGWSPDFYVPENWKPSEATRAALAERRATRAAAKAKAEVDSARFKAGWAILRQRYAAALSQHGILLKEDTQSDLNEFGLVATRGDKTAHFLAGGPQGPHYRTSLSDTADWLDANAATFDIPGEVAWIKDKLT